MKTAVTSAEKTILTEFISFCASHLDLYFCPRCVIRYFSAFHNSSSWSGMFIGIFEAFLAGCHCWRRSHYISMTHWGHKTLHLGSFLLLILCASLKGRRSFRKKMPVPGNLKRSILASPHFCSLRWSLWFTNFLNQRGFLLITPVGELSGS